MQVTKPDPMVFQSTKPVQLTKPDRVVAMSTLMAYAVGVFFVILAKCGGDSFAADELKTSMAQNSTREVERLIRIELFRSCKICPAYQVTVLKDGQTIYIGKEFVNVQGTQYSQLDSNSLAKLLTEIDHLGIDQLFPNYVDKNVADADVMEISEWRDGQEKIVRFQGHAGGAPVKLRRFVYFLDRLVGTKKWVCPVPAASEYVCKDM